MKKKKLFFFIKKIKFRIFLLFVNLFFDQNLCPLVKVMSPNANMINESSPHIKFVFYCLSKVNTKLSAAFLQRPVLLCFVHRRIYNVAPCCVCAIQSQAPAPIATPTWIQSECAVCVARPKSNQLTVGSSDFLSVSSDHRAVICGLPLLRPCACRHCCCCCCYRSSPEIKCHQVVNFVSLPMATTTTTTKTTTTTCKSLSASSLRSLIGEWGKWEWGACAAGSCLLMIVVGLSCLVTVPMPNGSYSPKEFEHAHTDTHTHAYKAYK